MGSCNLYAIDAGTGARQWTFRGDSSNSISQMNYSKDVLPRHMSPPVVWKDTMFLYTRDPFGASVLFALHAKNGTQKCRKQLVHRNSMSLELPPVLTADGVAILAHIPAPFQYESGNLVSTSSIVTFGVENGIQLWSFACPRNNVNGKAVS